MTLDTPARPEPAPGTDPEADPDAALRDRLADALAEAAAFDGWSRTALAGAARQLGLPEGEAERLFPGGPLQIFGFLAERSDRRTMADMEQADLAGLKLRERITLAVRLRIERHGGEREAVRRAMGLLALPFNGALALRLLYRTVDAIWYAAGDASTDFSFYTKRATLAGVYSATLLYWLNDRTPGGEATWHFLDRRIEDVMRIEKAKARARSWRGFRPGLVPRR